MKDFLGRSGATFGTLLLLLAAGCSSGTEGEATASTERDADWFTKSTVSLRGTLSVPSAATLFEEPELAQQQAQFDPGAALRCEVETSEGFRSAVKEIGGFRWDYYVQTLEDLSQPRIASGFYYARDDGATNAGTASGAPVEIAKADIVALTAEAALYHSPGHGLFVIALGDGEPEVRCAVKLPGEVKKFYLYDGHLLAMVENFSYGAGKRSHLLHFTVEGTTLSFVESVPVANGAILDSRRFNDQLVLYTGLTLAQDAATSVSSSTASSVAGSWAQPVPASEHRAMKVFRIGDRLERVMDDTLLDSTVSEEYLRSQEVAKDTSVGTELHRSTSFGDALWASDRYFALNQNVTRTLFAGFETNYYDVCVKSHTVEEPYTSCTTKYETRPNPAYVAPTNSGGDRSCDGQSLRACLRRVARVSNPTIQVPVETKCQEAIRSSWYCDAYEQKSYTFPVFDHVRETKLFIYEYTESGFIRLADEVRTIENPGLAQLSLDDSVTTLTTSDTSQELLLAGNLQNLQFQNGFLYAISDGELRTFAIDGSSLVQTSQVTAASDLLETSLFTNEKLYLSDWSWVYGSGDQSRLRIFDLTNAAFPKQASQDQTLPGGHSVLLPMDQGLLTIGSVREFEGNSGNWLKESLFEDPFGTELSHLIVGSDLEDTYPTGLSDGSYYFGSADARLFLPYVGNSWDSARHEARIGVSRVVDKAIVSEGAIVLPEVPERVRPVPAQQNSYLAFAPNSLHRLTPAGNEWAAAPFFEYFTTRAVYRLSDEEQYLELLQLGRRCKLHVASVDRINDRSSDKVSEEFECGNPGAEIRAFGHHLIFGRSWESDTQVVEAAGVRFELDGTVESLTQDETRAIEERIDARQVCVLARVLVENSRVDYSKTPDLSQVGCMTELEYDDASEVAATKQ